MRKIYMTIIILIILSNLIYALDVNAEDVIYFDLDDIDNPIWDSSGIYNFTHTNPTGKFQKEPLPAYSTNSIHFNGSDYMNSNAGFTTRFNTLKTDAWEVSLWINLTDSGDDQSIIARVGATEGFSLLYDRTTNQQYYVVFITDGTPNFNLAGFNPQNYGPHMVSLGWNLTHYYIFLNDSALTNSASDITDLDNYTTIPFRIGADNDENFDILGNLDEFIVFNYSLTYTQRADLFANGITLADVTPPTVNILYPTDNLNISSNFIDLNATATDDINTSSMTFYWVINGTLNSTTTQTNSTFNASDGYYNLTLFVYDGIQNGSDTVLFSLDTGEPIIIMYYPNSANTTRTINLGEITLNSTFTDNRDLYVYNVSIYKISDSSLMFNESAYISGTSYSYSSLINTLNWTNTSYREEIRVCDSHTNSRIEKANIIRRIDELIYQFGDTIISIQSINGNEFSANTEYKTNKYDFSFGYSKETDEKIFRITTNKNINYLPYSDYKGHFIVNNEIWVDFENNFDADVLVKQVNDTYYIHIISDDNYIIFSSLGFLNCATKHYSFEFILPPTAYDIDLLTGNWFNTDILNTGTTAGVLLFFFMFFVLVALVTFTEYVKIPAFALLTGIYGIFLGFLLYVVISAIMGFIIIILSVFYLMSMFRFL